MTAAPDLFCGPRSFIPGPSPFVSLNETRRKNQSPDVTTAILVTTKRCLTKR